MIKEIVEDMRSEPEFALKILEPLEVLGVDQFASSAVIIKARIKTKPIQQWSVGRAFNRRMKRRFDELGIEIPFPHQTIYFGVDTPPELGSPWASGSKQFGRSDMTKNLTGRLLAQAAAVCVATGLAGGAKAGTAEPHNVIEAARNTVEDFDGGPHRTRFRATIRRADAVVIVPPAPSAGNRSSGNGRPAVAVVHDGARGSWSNPAFYRVRVEGNAASVGDAGVMLMVIKTDAVRQLKAGAVALEGADGLDVTSMTNGVEPGVEINATADVLAFVDVKKGLIGPSSFSGWRLTADQALNESYYDDGSTAATILSRGAVRTPGAEKLIGGLRIAKGTHPPLP